MASRLLLTEEDFRTLAGMVSSEMRRVQNPRLRTLTTADLPSTPDIYACLTPTGGIPAMRLDPDVGTGTGGTYRAGSGNTPGVATCQVYQVVVTNATPDMYLVGGITRDVYNLGTRKIPEKTWILGERDKYGTWWAVQPANSLPYDRYLARTPVGGIPALGNFTTGTPSSFLLDDVPGSATCAIYDLKTDGSGLVRINDPATNLPLSLTIYNVLDWPIAENKWVVVELLPSGLWVVPNSGLGFSTC